jgi:DNA-directed RNA polymerase subunit M/transcription elongation factor TFIIS
VDAGTVGNHAPEFDGVHQRTVEHLKFMTDVKTSIESTEKCPNRKCGSKLARGRPLQVRSADEAMTFFMFCTVCSTPWISHG